MLASLDDDVKSYMSSIVCDVKPATAAALQESIGPFIESTGASEADIRAVCERVFQELGLAPKAGKGASSGRGAGGATPAAGGAGAGAGAAAGAGGDASSTRKLGAAVTVKDLARDGDDDLMAFLWGKDTTERSSQFNQVVVLGDPDAKALKKAARLAKKQDAIDKRLASTTEGEETASGGPVLSGAVDGATRLQVASWRIPTRVPVCSRVPALIAAAVSLLWR
jgi:hypothetical protein